MNSRRPMSSTGLLPHFGLSAPAMTISPPTAPSPCRQEITSKAAVRTGLPAHAAHLVGWSGVMRTIGAISDTHGLLRPQALSALAGCDPIIHAGDACEARRAGAGPRRARKRRSRRLEREPTCDAADRDRWLPHYVLHILAELDPQAADKVDAVI